jgi:hypothetical protein
MLDLIKDGHGSLTLLGMSGAGKTHLSAVLGEDGWAHYSADYEIGSKYLADHIDQSVLTRDNIRPISDFIGKLGNEAQGGFSYDLFCERQALYNKAELETLKDVARLSMTRSVPLVNDTSGSFCELGGLPLYADLAETSLFVYLDASDEEDVLIERGVQYPKPMYFQPEFLSQSLATYMAEQKIETDQQIEPDHFAQWVFPKLFHSRIPKYEALADQYGVTLQTSTLKNVGNAKDFLDLVAEALHKKENKTPA